MQECFRKVMMALREEHYGVSNNYKRSILNTHKQ